MRQNHIFASYNIKTGTTDWSNSDGRSGTFLGPKHMERRESLLNFLERVVSIDGEASFEFHETAV